MSEPIYYAQRREDQWIAENLPLPEEGFYVDVGCAHPFTTSNTAFLRDRKWEGLAIDADPRWATEWENIPAFHYAVVSNSARVNYIYDYECPYRSRIGEGGLSVAAQSIEELLSRFEVEKIDFLSLDTEGTELEILRSFDFEKHDPPIIIVEYNAAHLPLVSAQQSPIPAFMHAKGYSLKHIAGPVNMIFAK